MEPLPHLTSKINKNCSTQRKCATKELTSGMKEIPSRRPKSCWHGDLFSKKPYAHLWSSKEWVIPNHDRLMFPMFELGAFWLHAICPGTMPSHTYSKCGSYGTSCTTSPREKAKRALKVVRVGHGEHFVWLCKLMNCAIYCLKKVSFCN